MLLLWYNASTDRSLKNLATCADNVVTSHMENRLLYKGLSRSAELVVRPVGG